MRVVNRCLEPCEACDGCIEAHEYDLRAKVAELEAVIERATDALQSGETGDCHACDEEGGTNSECYVCTALMHLHGAAMSGGKD